MVKTETDETLEGIELRVRKYHRNGYPLKDLGEFLEDSDRLQQEMDVEDNEYRHRYGKIKSILGSYGPSQIFLSYLCDDGDGHMQNAMIITAFVEYGRETKALIEHFLNSNGTIVGTALQRHRRLEDVDFELQESGDTRRTLYLSTGAEYPLGSLNEHYVMFVAERNNQNESRNGNSVAELYAQTVPHNAHEPLKWYQRFAKVIKDNLKI